MSGSSTMSVRLWVRGGMLLNVSGGLTPSPSHEYLAAIWPLSAKAGLLIFKSAAASPTLDTTAAHIASTKNLSVFMVGLQRKAVPKRLPTPAHSLCYTTPA